MLIVMKPTLRAPTLRALTLAAAATLATFAATPASAALNAFLKIGGTPAPTTSAARAGHKDWIEVTSWSWGTSNARKGWDGSIKGRASAEKYGAVSGAHRDEGVAHDVVSPRDTASGMPTGKRQHGWMPVAQTLDRGSVRVKVRFPWLDCRVGATFPDATLDDAAGRNSFSEVTVTRCDNDAVTLSYAKVTVRGWDPAKKEE